MARICILVDLLGAQFANRISGTVVGFITGFGGWSIGGFVANWLDSMDVKPNNGWIEW